MEGEKEGQEKDTRGVDKGRKRQQEENTRHTLLHVCAVFRSLSLPGDGIVRITLLTQVKKERKDLDPRHQTWARVRMGRLTFVQGNGLVLGALDSQSLGPGSMPQTEVYLSILSLCQQSNAVCMLPLCVHSFAYLRAASTKLFHTLYSMPRASSVPASSLSSLFCRYKVQDTLYYPPCTQIPPIQCMYMNNHVHSTCTPQ